jgi:hypothetical protein
MSDYIEVKTFKRLSDDKVSCEGLIWSTDWEKAMPFKNDETGRLVHSIKIGETYYYPIAFDNRKKKE